MFELARDATVAFPRTRSGVLIWVRRGDLVVTQTNDPEDHVLGAGDVLMLPPGGLAVAWALTPSVFEVRDAREAQLVHVAEAA